MAALKQRIYSLNFETSLEVKWRTSPVESVFESHKFPCDSIPVIEFYKRSLLIGAAGVRVV